MRHARLDCEGGISLLSRPHATVPPLQAPKVAILGCSDSRVPIEIVFDQGLGDMFVVRVAGNCCDMSTRASLQYAVAHLGVKLVVVLGGPLQPQPSAPVSRWLSSALAPFPSPRRLGMWRVHSVLSASAACDGWVVGNNRLALRPSLHVPQRRARGLWCGGSCSSIRLNQGGDAGGSARAAACAVLDSNPTASTQPPPQRAARCSCCHSQKVASSIRDPVGIWLGSGWDLVGIWWGSAVDLVGVCVGSGGDLVGIRLGSDHLA